MDYRAVEYEKCLRKRALERRSLSDKRSGTAEIENTKKAFGDKQPKSINDRKP
jgi:hypothetical protein